MNKSNLNANTRLIPELVSEDDRLELMTDPAQVPRRDAVALHHAVHEEKVPLCKMLLPTVEQEPGDQHVGHLSLTDSNPLRGPTELHLLAAVQQSQQQQSKVQFKMLRLHNV